MICLIPPYGGLKKNKNLKLKYIFEARRDRENLDSSAKFLIKEFLHLSEI